MRQKINAVAKPTSNEYAPFYQGYVTLCTENDPLEALEKSLTEWSQYLSALDPELANYRYAEGKWTVNQLLAHCIDTERIFQYRVLRIAREEQAQLMGFDENAFADAYPAHTRSIQSLQQEFEAIRASSLLLFQSLEKTQLNKAGHADGKVITINALGFIMAGHGRHHLNILNERYAITAS